MTSSKRLDKDIRSFLNIYCEFEFKPRSDKKYSLLRGPLDVCGIDGKFWNSFDINIYIESQKYPFTTPLVQEVSEKVERTEDWHVDKEGFCCLGIDHELEQKAKRGLDITCFYQEIVYPFFTNTILKQKTGSYANGEYKHKENGIQEYYAEKLQLFYNDVITKLLEAIYNYDIPDRNHSYCLCGKNKKFKHCHLEAVERLNRFSRQRIYKDLIAFKSLE
jgi:hypothetical protein